MAHTMSKISDFFIKIIMTLMTLVSIAFFAGYYPNQAFIFGFLGLLFVIAIITKGLFDIFSKE